MVGEQRFFQATWQYLHALPDPAPGARSKTRFVTAKYSQHKHVICDFFCLDGNQPNPDPRENINVMVCPPGPFGHFVTFILLICLKYDANELK